MNPYHEEQEQWRHSRPPNLPQPFHQGQPPVQPGVYPYLPPSGLSPYQELSPKSKTTAGLLQLLLGFFLLIGGVGRLYAGNVGLGLAQLFTGILAWICFWCGGALFFFPWVVTLGAWAWFVIDGIVLLANGGRDGEGRPLRA